MPTGADLVITLITDAGLDLTEVLVESLESAYGDDYLEPPDAEVLADAFTVQWSRPLRGDGAKVLHRVTFSPLDSEDGQAGDRIAADLCDELRALVEDTDIAVHHVVWFQHPAQVSEHAQLHAELYDLEMRLREALTYIFLDLAPDRCYQFLDGNQVKPQNNDMLTDEYLRSHGENKLFHVLFADYPKINQPPVNKPGEVIRLIAEHENYEDLRGRITDLPIQQSRHAGFLANLTSLIGPIEDVRNAVAHHRGIPNRARENYPKAKQTLFEAIDAFWLAESRDREEELEETNGAADDQQ